MTQFDLFTGTASNVPVFRVPPVTIWRDASFEIPGRNRSTLFWVALWGEVSGWSVFRLGWDKGSFCKIEREFKEIILSNLEIRKVPDLVLGESLFSSIHFDLLRVYWCEVSEFSCEDDALESLNSSDNHD